MDPNASLTELRDLATRIVNRADGLSPSDVGDVDRLAELALALDEWITRRGSLPNAWAHNRQLTQEEVDALGLSPYGNNGAPWRLYDL